MKRIEKYYWLLLPIVGLMCVIMPDKIAQWLPGILGSIMILTSVTDTAFAIKEKRYMIAYKNKASALILLIMGICFILGQESTIPLMGIIWGLLGLQEVNEEIETILMRRIQKENYLLLPIFAGLKLVLSLALLFEFSYLFVGIRDSCSNRQRKKY